MVGAQSIPPPGAVAALNNLRPYGRHRNTVQRLQAIRLPSSSCLLSGVTGILASNSYFRWQSRLSQLQLTLRQPTHTEPAGSHCASKSPGIRHEVKRPSPCVTTQPQPPCTPRSIRQRLSLIIPVATKDQERLTTYFTMTTEPMSLSSHHPSTPATEIIAIATWQKQQV